MVAEKKKPRAKKKVEPIPKSTPIPERTPIVLRLRVKINKFHENLFITESLQYSPTVADPEPYDPFAFPAASTGTSLEPDNTLRGYNDFQKVTFKKKNVYVLPQPKDNNNLNCRLTMRQLFADQATWPNKTDIYCWWCCHPFDSVPVGIPVRLIDDPDGDKKRDMFVCKGVFCGFHCAAAYLHQDRTLKSDAASLLNMLYRRSTEDPTYYHIKRAPPREVLNIFGGALSVEEFRQSSRDERQFSIVSLPLIPLTSHIQEIMPSNNILDDLKVKHNHNATKRNQNRKSGKKSFGAFDSLISAA